MNFQFYLEKLFANKNFKNFKEKNKKVFPCSCFFSIDKKGNDNKQHFDYFVPSEKKLFSFKIEENGEKVPIDLIDDKTPNEIDLNFDFDFNEIEDLVLEKMEKENIKNKIEKIFFSLQKVEGKNLLIGTIFLSMMGLLQVHIDISEKKIIYFEKKSFFDIVKVSKKKD